jgi:hypothetical protein
MLNQAEGMSYQFPAYALDVASVALAAYVVIGLRVNIRIAVFSVDLTFI